MSCNQRPTPELNQLHHLLSTLHTPQQRRCLGQTITAWSGVQTWYDQGRHLSSGSLYCSFKHSNSRITQDTVFFGVISHGYSLSFFQEWTSSPLFRQGSCPVCMRAEITGGGGGYTRPFKPKKKKGKVPTKPKNHKSQ